MNLLFKEGFIGKLKLKNRIIMSAMHMGMDFEKEAAFLAERSKGGACLVTSVMGVHASATPSDMNIISEENAQKISEMAEEIHEAGGKLSVQLFHAGRNAKAGGLCDSDAVPVAPSAIPSPIYKTVPKELNEKEIVEIFKYFSEAAEICKEANVDAVEISASAGYLLSEFLSNRTNLREDKYGGSLEKRFTFPLEVIEKVREAVGVDYPVILRISGLDMIGGYGLKDMQQFSAKAEKYVDAISVTGGWHEAAIPQITMQVPEGNFAFLSGAIKQFVNVPVIACNRINNGETAEEILEEGYSDFVGCARAFLTDSHFAVKVKRKEPYKKCVGCNKGCIERVLKGEAPTCIFNPTIGHEGELETKEELNKKYLVVGGGPAGLSAAINLAKKGNEVRLCTKDKYFGGMMHYASKSLDKKTFADNINAMFYEANYYGVELVLNTYVDSRYIKVYNPDEVVIAVGGNCSKPPIEGIDNENVFELKDIFDLDKKELNLLLQKKVCIIGGGASGVELALYILNSSKIMKESRTFLDLYNLDVTKNDFDYDGNITILEMKKKVAKDLGSTRWILMKEIDRYPIDIKTEVTVEKIGEDFVVIKDKDGIENIRAEIVILATGYKPAMRDLVEWLRSSKYKYHEIGDCAGNGQGVMNAIEEAYKIS